MSSTQSSEVKLRLLLTLAENSGRWIAKTPLALKSDVDHADRIQSSLDFFKKYKFVKVINWEILTKKERKEHEKKYNENISSTTKILYQLDLKGWQKLQRSLQNCFENENVLNLLNVPEDIRKKLASLPRL